MSREERDILLWGRRLSGVEERELTVSFDYWPIVVPLDLIEDIVPADACTIHTSQRSE